MSKNPRIKALAKFLHKESGDESETFYAESMQPTTYDKCMIQTGHGASSPEYLVLTDREADKRATDYIKDSIWAFNAKFIASHSKIGHDATIKVVEALQPQCEGANDEIKSLIKNMSKFVAQAIQSDGRAHFLSTYDGHEHEVVVGSKRYYIYRVN